MAYLQHHQVVLSAPQEDHSLSVTMLIILLYLSEVYEPAVPPVVPEYRISFIFARWNSFDSPPPKPLRRLLKGSVLAVAVPLGAALSTFEALLAGMTAVYTTLRKHA